MVLSARRAVLCLGNCTGATRLPQAPAGEQLLQEKGEGLLPAWHSQESQGGMMQVFLSSQRASGALLM